MERRRQGFTLIELMVVVVIMGIVTALVIPALLSSLGKARQKKRAEKGGAQQAPPGVVPDALPQGGVPPDLERIEIDVDLSASHHRVGMKVHTRYEAAVQGRFVLVSPHDAKGPVRVDIRFPANTMEARGVALEFGGPERKEGSRSPRGVVYHRGGILWVGELPSPRVRATVTFVALGRERFEYRLPSARRIGAVEVRMAIRGAPQLTIPDEALQPTSRSARRLEWSFTNLVTDRQIVVEILGALGPIGGVMLLFKLVGIAVLLFGAGFWYLSELHKPGCLDGFRFAHFLLLALTYSLFFVVFAVLSFQGDVDPPVAMAIAALTSLPMLVLHVKSVLGLRFSLVHVLPLTLGANGMVINGVYGGPVREYVCVGAATLALAFVLVTYRRWSSRREVHLKENEGHLRGQMGVLDESFTAARENSRTARALLLRRDPEHLQGLRERIAERAQRIAGFDEELRGLRSRFTQMEGMSAGFARRSAFREVAAAVRALEPKAGRGATELRSAVEELERARQEPGHEAAPAGDDGHCMACGHEAGEAPFCSQCGTRRSKRLDCRSCGAAVDLPVHLIPVHLIGDTGVPLYCRRCGAQHEAPAPGAEGAPGPA